MAVKQKDTSAIGTFETRSFFSFLYQHKRTQVDNQTEAEEKMILALNYVCRDTFFQKVPRINKQILNFLKKQSYKTLE